MKFQPIAQFVIIPHTINVQEQSDLDKQWLLTTYKLSDVVMEKTSYGLGRTTTDRETI